MNTSSSTIFVLENIAIYQGNLKNKVFSLSAAASSDVLAFRDRLYDACMNNIPDLLCFESQQGERLFAVNPRRVSVITEEGKTLNIIMA